MFTGIIVDIGRIITLDSHGEDLRAKIAVNTLALDDIHSGDSIAVNGVCLTVVDGSHAQFAVDISAETLSCTTLGLLKPESRVNLETALTPTTALGGHMVSGHVDGVGKITGMQDDGRSTRYECEVPANLGKYIVAKGSITVDGVSLTVNTVSDNTFSVNIIPHTMEKTIFSDYQMESSVNLEIDIIARYLEKLITK